MIEDLTNKAMWATGQQTVFRRAILPLRKALMKKLLKNKKNKHLRNQDIKNDDWQKLGLPYFGETQVEAQTWSIDDIDAEDSITSLNDRERDHVKLQRLPFNGFKANFIKSSYAEESIEDNKHK